MEEQSKSIDLGALYADETPHYRFPYEVEAGDEVIFRFRTRSGDAAHVFLAGRAIRREMTKAFTRGIFDYYETRLTVGGDRFFYGFEVSDGHRTVWYDRLGPNEHAHFHPERAFRILPGFSTPGWMHGAVMYQIFVDRFCNGDPGNDVLSGEYAYLNGQVEGVKDWSALPKADDTRRHFGGDLVGVLQKLDYLKHLGVDVIYLNPIFVSPSNHKYDTQDYDHVDPHFTGFAEDGGELLPEGCTDNHLASRYRTRVTSEANLNYANAFFAHLVEEIHKRGMKVILDGVFNHCGSFNKWMDTEGIYEGREGYEPGAFVSGDSPYHDYFYFGDRGTWPHNGDFLGWWDYLTLPKLNYEKSAALREYVLGIARKWVSPPYNCDGWRLDVAAELGASNEANHAFWRDFRKAVKEENPNAVIIAEHYGSPEHWLRGDQWDTVMNYDAFMEPVTYFLTGMEKHSDYYSAELGGNGPAFFRNLQQASLKLPTASLYIAMNELSNHDHSRFLTRTNHMAGRLSDRGSAAATEGVSYATFREGVVMQFTLPGAPTIYYGDETGLGGWTDPDNRRTFPWGQENWDLIAFHHDLIKIHKRFSCIRYGSFKPLQADYGYISYGRFDEAGSVLVIINHAEHERQVEIPVSEIEVTVDGEMRRIFKTNDAAYNVGEIRCPVKDGILKRTVEAWSAEIYVEERS